MRKRPQTSEGRRRLQNPSLGKTSSGASLYDEKHNEHRKASKGASNRILIWGQPSKTEASGRQNTKKQAGARTHPGEHEKHEQGLFTKTRIVIERDFTGRGGDGKSPESLLLL
jgi:hypothetical protein